MKEKLLNFLLPTRQSYKLLSILYQFIVGCVLKYVFGGTVLDLLGHLIIFLSALNILHLIEGKISNKLNLVLALIIVGISFTLLQMLGILLINNLLNLKLFLSK